MRINKCDICGKVYNTDRSSKKSGYVAMFGQTEDGVFDNENYDLCPECTEKLKTIVHGMIGDKQDN